MFTRRGLFGLIAGIFVKTTRHNVQRIFSVDYEARTFTLAAEVSGAMATIYNFQPFDKNSDCNANTTGVWRLWPLEICPEITGGRMETAREARRRKSESAL